MGDHLILLILRPAEQSKVRESRKELRSRDLQLRKALKRERSRSLFIGRGGYNQAEFLAEILAKLNLVERQVQDTRYCWQAR